MKLIGHITLLVVALFICWGGWRLFGAVDNDGIEFCGYPSKVACHCAGRVEKIQTKAGAVCNSPDWRNFYKTLTECYGDIATRYSFCSLAETWSEYDYPTDHVIMGGDGSIPATESTMGPMCSMACKRHDCKCARDNQTESVCHFGHNMADHHPKK